MEEWSNQISNELQLRCWECVGNATLIRQPADGGKNVVNSDLMKAGE